MYYVGTELSSLSSNSTSSASNRGNQDDVPESISVISTVGKVGKKTLILKDRPKRPEASSILNKDMLDLIDTSMKDNLSEIVTKVLGDVNVYKLFLRTVLFSVIRRKRWNDNYRNKAYHEFITPSDEAFGILVLDNSGDRFICMALNMKTDNKNMCIPKYTTVNGEKKMRVTDRGWDSIGTRRYFKLEKEITEWRQKNGDIMEDIDKALKDEYNVNNEAYEEDEDNETFKRQLEEEEAQLDVMTMFREKIRRVEQV